MVILFCMPKSEFFSKIFEPYMVRKLFESALQPNKRFVNPSFVVKVMNFYYRLSGKTVLLGNDATATTVSF